MRRIESILSREFLISEKVSGNILSLLEEGATIPFIARYRKETTGGMLDVDLRRFYDRWQYLEELEKRRATILNALEKTSNCPASIYTKVRNASSKSELEDLYEPFKSTRKSKSTEAIEKGLEPLAKVLWLGQVMGQPDSLNKWLASNQIAMSSDEALEGALDIIVERISQEASLLQQGRHLLMSQGEVISKLVRGKEAEGEKYRDYFEYKEAVRKVPAHRLLALFRGKKESILKLSIELPNEVEALLALNLSALSLIFSSDDKPHALTKGQLDFIKLAWEKKVLSKLEGDVFSNLKEKAEESAISVFSSNLNDLLMSPPAGAHTVIGLDPGFRNGVKMAVVNELGELIGHEVIYPFSSDAQKDTAKSKLHKMIQAHHVSWLAIGNGTASRETMLFAEELIKQHALSCRAIVVSEAGASVYSASETGIAEFPDLDVTIRGAISIARRFQDPLAELVKIDPQAIGVGQYQHDVKATRLSQSLGNVVEDCVNKVGVDVNLASASLLAYVAGLSKRIAQNVVDYRREKGRIESRQELLKVKGVGAKSFEQCAGFLRILNGKNALDASGVHPESYSLVNTMAGMLSMSITDLLGNAAAVAKLQTMYGRFSDVDRYTFDDTLKELAKPGRDPRPAFRYATFDQSVQTIGDLVEGMTLEGVVTNVAAFGAFVDIGVHQDGLVHISQLADRFVKDPRDLVRVGQVIKVTVLEVDEKRKRIGLKASGL